MILYGIHVLVRFTEKTKSFPGKNRHCTWSLIFWPFRKGAPTPTNPLLSLVIIHKHVKSAPMVSWKPTYMRSPSLKSLTALSNRPSWKSRHNLQSCTLRSFFQCQLARAAVAAAAPEGHHPGWGRLPRMPSMPCLRTFHPHHPMWEQRATVVEVATKTLA